MHLDWKPMTFAALTAIATCFPSTIARGETVLTFEGQGGNNAALTSYGGLDWSQLYALDNSYLAGSAGGYVADAVSGNTGAYDPSQVGGATSSTPFTFNSAYFTGAYNDGLNVTIEGWRSGGLLYSTSFTVDASTPTFRTFDYAGIDDLRITSFGGTLSPSVTYGG